MVIIGVEEGYREARTVAMRVGLCRSGESCGELVERLFCLGIFRSFREIDVEIFVPRGTFTGAWCLGSGHGANTIPTICHGPSGLNQPDFSRPDDGNDTPELDVRFPSPKMFHVEHFHLFRPTQGDDRRSFDYCTPAF